MKKLLSLAIVAIALTSCEKMNVVPHSISKCGIVTGKTEFKGGYLIFIDNVGFSFPKNVFDEKSIGDSICKNN